MKRILSLVVLISAFVVAASAGAQVFDGSIGRSWEKLPAVGGYQWSVMPAKGLRIDFVSYIEDDGKRTTYYLVRRKCQNGRLQYWVTKPGAKLGLGVDCNGHDDMFPGAGLILETNKVNPLPAEAAALIPTAAERK